MCEKNIKFFIIADLEGPEGAQGAPGAPGALGLQNSASEKAH